MGVDRVRRALPLLLILTVVLAACAGAATGGRDEFRAPVEQPAATAAPAAAVPAEEPTGGRTTDGGEEQPPGALRDETKVVYQGSMQLVVDNVDTAVVTASGIVRGAGGYIGASERSSDGENPVATITYRIPAEAWEDVLDQLRQLGTKVAGERTTAVEVTGQIVDLEARIRNLRATETALQAILARAERIADVLEVQRELTGVRGEIERLDAQRAALEDQAAYGTLAVTYGVELLAVTEAAKEWDPATEVDRAVASLMSVLQGLATVGIWFAIVWLPLLLVIGAVAAATVLLLRRFGFVRREVTPTPTA